MMESKDMEDMRDKEKKCGGKKMAWVMIGP